jgi:hypothetical protein
MQVTQLLLAVVLATSSASVAADEAMSAVAAASEHSHAHHHAGIDGMGKPAAWTSFPTLKIKTSGENRESQIITVVPQNIVAESVVAYSNNLTAESSRRELAIGMAGAKLDKPNNTGFHLLTAREESFDAVRVANTVYYFGERGAKNPTAMFMLQKNELEIIPQPFPREHSRYRVNEDWKFLVRFKGQSLVQQKVNLDTQNGSHLELLSDAQGVVTVHIPDDFKAEETDKTAGGHNHGMRRGSDFVLATELAADGKSYVSSFNSSYGADAFDQRSLMLGLGFTFLGMLGAVPLLRQRKVTKKVSPQAANDSVSSNQSKDA